MQRARRSSIEPRVDMLPLIDVVFLLLTFFIFALALSVRFELTNVRLPRVASGETVEDAPAVRIELRSDGTLAIDDAVVEWDLVEVALDETLPGADLTRVYLAIDRESSSGDLFRVVDLLRARGVEDLRFLRSPASPTPIGGADDAPGS
ncbi:MAG: biopolymer transporter ExbD [Planctomycetota bacterium]